MFKIKKLRIFSPDNEEFVYKFKAGINYFRGGNSTGKTEFYKFIDFMFGSSEDISKKNWFKNSFKQASMIFEYNSIKYNIIRTLDKEKNYFLYESETLNESDHINLNEYKDKLNAVFSNDEILKELKLFTNENLTYRTFTMFNFLGEKRQGLTYNFLDKCSDIKYYTKLNWVLNYIFNKNLGRIFELQEEIEKLKKEIKNLELMDSKYAFICTQVNENLKKLTSSKIYNGKNAEMILKFISDYKKLNMDEVVKKSKNIADLEFAYNQVDEQIKVYENRKIDSKEILKEYQNREILLKNLNVLLERNKELDYLVEPLNELLEEMDESISFSKYLIKDRTIIELKREREFLKEKLKDSEYRFKIFSIDEKKKSILLIEEYLGENIKDVNKELNIKKKALRSLTNEMKDLQNKDDNTKINSFSEYMTNLYKVAAEVSEIVSTDVSEKGFKIEYIKRGNVLQPKKKDIVKNEEVYVNYYMGSMARHTLIQICGYLAFIKLLINENRVPLIPIIVFDHISKPFDEQNVCAVGKVISKFYEDVSKNDIQMFIFDDKEFENLGLDVDIFAELKNDYKTGFNPFYAEQENSK
ncbi:hypothetical protein OA45_02537 [Bacillus sp. UMTAT18]|uniref:hypothetical protein n=1 Tax=Bacillus TaxID=1386 RepID=UPI00061F74C2|nr:MULTISPECIES: hypothetical protein [unclassified Bacillus (in: firmicutes)]KKC54846.1 hypothetical protein OA45_02537 [Bacillus sp. UMTAT18]OJD76690.1 hypothetical protein BAU29_19635 [Bacillus sp. P14-1]